MSWLQTLSSALRTIGGHRLRSFLTTLGILFGVGAVIATVGVGQGSQQSVQASINSLGTNLITVTPVNNTAGSSSRGASSGSSSTLTLSDVAALSSSRVAPDIGTVAPVVQAQATLAQGATTWSTTLVGSTPGWLTSNARSMASGAFLLQSDVDAHVAVVVLGETTAASLGAAVGDSVTITGIPFQVVGILAASGSQGFSNADDTAVIPLTVAKDEFTGSGSSVQRILLSATSADTVSAAYQEANQALLTSHHVTDPAQPDFTLTTQSSLASTAQSVTQTLTLLLASVAAISLLVGGIGVMNIMLVSVTERISEIGLRKALGATRRDIFRQFLVEAAALSVVGGILGVGAGMLTGSLLHNLANVAVFISWSPVLGAVGVAMATGLLFGIFPAVRAARLAPIEALRSQ